MTVTNNQIGLLSKYHSIILSKTEINDYETLLSFTENYLKISPLFIKIDTYNCHWSPAYRKYHMSHYCGIIDIDRKNECFICIDPYTTTDIVQLPFVELTSWKEHCFTIQHASKSFLPNCSQSLYDQLSIQYQNLEKIKMLECLENFREDLKYNYDLEHECKGYQDYYAVPINLNLKRLYSQRGCYLYFLQLLRENYKNKMLDDFSINIKQLANYYDRFRLLNLMFCMKKKVNNNQLINMFDEIIKCEQKCYSMLKQLI